MSPETPNSNRINFDTASVSWRTLQRKQGEQWQATLAYYVDGKRKRKTKVFPASKDLGTERKRKAALRAWISELHEEQDAVEREAATRAEEERAKAEQSALPGANMAVGDYVTCYIDVLEAAGSVRPSAISDYRTSAKRIAEGIGDIALKDLTPAAIQSWEARLLGSGKSVNTVLKYHRLLNSVYRHAISVRDVEWNPCPAVKKPKRTSPSPNSLNAEQHARLNATLNAMGASPTVTAAAIALYTGMREGEICGLKWKCYDEKAGIIRVENAVAKAGGKSYESEPKTDAGRRSVPVHPALAAILERRRLNVVRELEEAFTTLSDGEFGELYVIGYIDGRYLSPTILSRSWKSLAESFELIGTQGRRVTFHDLRHSFATRAIAEGADVKAVAAVLGHADAHVTINVYADADKESKRRAVTLVGQGIAAQGDVRPFAELVPTSSP